VQGSQNANQQEHGGAASAVRKVGKPVSSAILMSLASAVSSPAAIQPTTDILYSPPHLQSKGDAAVSIDMNLLSSDNAGPIHAINVAG
jgi:hypothetical protein